MNIYNELSSDLSVVDRFVVQSDTMENDVIDWIKSFGSGKKSINLFQTTRDLMFGEAGNFYILLARNAEAEEITGIAINSWNQHAFSFKYDTSFSYSKLTTNADLDGILYTLSDGSTGIEAGSGSTKYRLQLVADGRLMLFKSTDGGSTWPTNKVVNSI